MVHLGDFGYWVPDPSTRKYLFRVEKRLAEVDMQLLFVDGNRGDHDRLTALPLDPATGLRPSVSTSRTYRAATAGAGCTAPAIHGPGWRWAAR